MSAAMHTWLKLALPAVAGLSLLLVTAGWVAGLFTAKDRRLSAPDSAEGVARLQAAPARDLARLRERERAELNRYAWVDREAGLVRIPIEQAMRRLLSRDPQQVFAEGPAETADGEGGERPASAVQRATARAKAAGQRSEPSPPAPSERPPSPPPAQVDQQYPSLGGPTPPPGEGSP